MIHDRWTTEFSAYWAGPLARMKTFQDEEDKKSGRKPAARPDGPP